MELMHGKDFDGQDPTGWLMSEKLDGFRAAWDGEFLYSKGGGWFMEPDWFAARLPAGVALDCELWLGRGTLRRLNSRVQRSHDDWRGIRLMVFDVIGPGTAEDRQAQLAALTLPAHCAKVITTTCQGRAHLRRFAASIISVGGEGAMVRRPGSPYKPGRSSDLLKVKVPSLV